MGTNEGKKLIPEDRWKRNREEAAKNDFYRAYPSGRLPQEVLERIKQAALPR